MIHPNRNADGKSTIWGTFINHISNERQKFGSRKFLRYTRLKYRVILNDSSKSKCLWNKYYLGHLHKSHIKWKGKVSIFNGGHYLSLIMNTNVLFTLQTKWRLQFSLSRHHVVTGQCPGAVARCDQRCDVRLTAARGVAIWGRGGHGRGVN